MVMTHTTAIKSGASDKTLGPRLIRLHEHQKRTERLNYVAIALASLLVIYVATTIIRPILFGHRPGQKTQDLGCISKSSTGEC